MWKLISKIAKAKLKLLTKEEELLFGSNLLSSR